MPEHVHLLVTAKSDDYDISFLHFVKQSVTNKARAFAKTSDRPSSIWEPLLDVQPSGKVYFRFWQRGGGYDMNVSDADQVREVLEYMHNNPVKRGLCDSPSNWTYSSAAYYLGHGEGPVPVTTAPI
jgi:putative transposase